MQRGFFSYFVEDITVFQDAYSEADRSAGRERLKPPLLNPDWIGFSTSGCWSAVSSKPGPREGLTVSGYGVLIY
jgi:hypothetical protein